MDFSHIALLVGLAAVFGFFAKLARQPLLIGYLFAGLLASYFGFLGEDELLTSLGKIGVSLLLFLVGMEIKIKELPTLGKVALVTGLGQIAFTSTAGTLVALALGYSLVTSIYIALALSFSSTIIIIKLLSEKRDLNSLYGKIAVGFLLVQDLVAVLILMFLAGLKTGEVNLLSSGMILFKAMALFVLTWFLSKKILPDLFEKVVGSSHELLFIASIAWALGLSAFIGGPLGFSFEIGGFLAGLSLSNLPEHMGVSSKTRPLRDFFLTIFFLTLGAQLLVNDFWSVLTPALIFSSLVLVGNPLIVNVLMGALGYKKRTSFLASVTGAQVSEFSFILMAMGLTLGHVGQNEVSTVVITGAITMTVSTYIILGAEKIYSKIKSYLQIFERKITHETVFTEGYNDLENHVVLIGCDRTGRTLLPYFQKKKIKIVVVDHNPDVYKSLKAQNVDVVLGDAMDADIQDFLRMDLARMIICTATSITENLSILEKIAKMPKKPLFIGSVQTKKEALSVYEKGADYVVVPEIVAGEFLRHIFVSHGLSEKRLVQMGRSHFNRLIYAKT